MFAFGQLPADRDELGGVADGLSPRRPAQRATWWRQPENSWAQVGESRLQLAVHQRQAANRRRQPGKSAPQAGDGHRQSGTWRAQSGTWRAQSGKCRPQSGKWGFQSGRCRRQPGRCPRRAENSHFRAAASRPHSAKGRRVTAERTVNQQFTSPNPGRNAAAERKETQCPSTRRRKPSPPTWNPCGRRWSVEAGGEPSAAAAKTPVGNAAHRPTRTSTSPCPPERGQGSVPAWHE